jgi:membrane protein YqaA with SNARE-associated domain
MIDFWLYASLFFSALLAATVLPMQSEAVFVGYLLAGSGQPWILLFIASVGNTLGSVINWLLGRGVERFRDRRWFPVRPSTLAKAQQWYSRWGRWSLLLSWAPIIGDPITVAAGVMRERFLRFLALVALAKTARYLVLMWLAGAV